LDETSRDLIETLCRHIPAESEENNVILSRDIRCFSRDSNRVSLKYEFTGLPLHESGTFLYEHTLIYKLILPATLPLKLCVSSPVQPVVS
jgi:hypothetical protein